MPRFCHRCGAALFEQGAFCPGCGTPVRSRAEPVQRNSHSVTVSAAFEADRRMRLRAGGLAAAALGVLLLGLIVVLANRSSSPDGGAAAPTAPQDVEASAPPVASTAARMRNSPSPARPYPSPAPTQQTTFTSMVESFIPSYEQADTEIRKTNVRFERKGAIAQYFARSGDLRFNGWVGKVEWLHTESDGEAAVSIKLSGSGTVIKTWSNSFSDSSPHTMISRDDSLYPVLTGLKQGDTVTVSGTFIRNFSGQDYVTEASVTEEGSMSSPEFIVRFGQINLGLPAPIVHGTEASTTSPSSPLPTNSEVPKRIPEEGRLGNDVESDRPVAAGSEGTFTGGRPWTSLATANDWNIRQDGDYLYIERANVPPELKAEGVFVRDELKKSPDGKWRGKGRSFLPCEYQSAFKYCKHEINFEIDLLSEKRIEGIAMEDDVEKFDCGKCEARGVRPIPFTWIPK